eukprot:7155326-Alexandrium_andersonii.AAC.1
MQRPSSNTLQTTTAATPGRAVAIKRTTALMAAAPWPARPLPSFAALLQRAPRLPTGVPQRRPAIAKDLASGGPPEVSPIARPRGRWARS